MDALLTMTSAICKAGAQKYLLLNLITPQKTLRKLGLNAKG